MNQRFTNSRLPVIQKLHGLPMWRTDTVNAFLTQTASTILVSCAGGSMAPVQQCLQHTNEMLPNPGLGAMRRMQIVTDRTGLCIVSPIED